MRVKAQLALSNFKFFVGLFSLQWQSSSFLKTLQHKDLLSNFLVSKQDLKIETLKAKSYDFFNIINNFLALDFSFVRLIAFAVAALFVLIGSLAAWSKNEGKGALQAAGAFGTLAGVSFGATAFFAFQMHKEYKDKQNEQNGKLS